MVHNKNIIGIPSQDSDETPKPGKTGEELKKVRKRIRKPAKKPKND
jgi:hypothetical protein